MTIQKVLMTGLLGMIASRGPDTDVFRDVAPAALAPAALAPAALAPAALAPAPAEAAAESTRDAKAPFGAWVSEQTHAGVRGRELADAIHAAKDQGKSAEHGKSPEKAKSGEHGKSAEKAKSGEHGKSAEHRKASPAE